MKYFSARAIHKKHSSGYGVYTNGKTTFVNAATLGPGYIPVNPPIVFKYEQIDKS